MERFYWIADGRLAGSSRPGGRRDERLGADLDELRTYGIGAIVSLTESPIDQLAVEDAGMTYAHVPIVDMTAPSPAQLLQALDAIDLAHAENRAVLVHCLAGQGRTGTILAAWRIRQGATTDDTLTEIRLVCDHAVENDLQINCLRAFEQDRGWVL